MLLPTLLAFVVILAVCAYVYGGRLVLAGFFGTLVFANVGISALSPQLASKLELHILQGSNFLFACIVFALVFPSVFRREPKLFGESRWGRSIPFLLLCLAYFGLGIVQNGFTAAAIYLRMFLLPVIMGYLGAWIGRTVSLRSAAVVFLAVSVLASGLIFTEVAYDQEYYALIHADGFYSLKNQTALTPVDLVERRQRRLLNYALFEDIRIFKPAGPTFNYPSSSYVVVFGMVLALAFGTWGVVPTLLAAIACLSTKAGIAAVLLLVLAAWAARKRFFFSSRGVHLIGVGYCVLMVAAMAVTRNIHTYSLLSTLLELPRLPLGGGLGYGGSVTADQAVTWQLDMVRGDSGVAIALSMFGVLAIWIYLFYLRRLRTLIDLAKARQDRPLFLIAMFGYVALFNSLLQELAIGPYGLGLAFMFAAIRLANHQAQAEREAVPTPAPAPAVPLPRAGEAA